MDDHLAETYRSLISISIEFFKALLLINGGSIVAILAFLGQASNVQQIAKCISFPLGCFVIGTCLSALAFFFSYATQFALFNERISPKEYSGPKHMCFAYFTAGIAVLSLVAFSVGAFTSIGVLANA